MSLRILYFYQYFGTPKGSYSTRVYEFARRWAAKGHKVTVITSIYARSDLESQSLIDRREIEGISVIILNIKLSNTHSFVTRVLTFMAYAILSTWYALTLKADLIVASSGPMTVGIPGIVAKGLRRIPFVLEVRDLWPEGAVQLGLLKGRLTTYLAYKFESLLYSVADRIIALSPGMADYIKKHYNCESVVIPNSSDNDLFDRISDGFTFPNWAENRKLVMYTGAIGYMDDCIQILKAAEELQKLNEDNILIVIFGEGKEKTFLESYAHEKNLSNVYFMGSLPKLEVKNWLQHAVCALVVFRHVPILDTSSPNKLFDALASGIPIIQTTQGWIKELLDKEKCGITVFPENPKDMANSIIRLVYNEELRDTMSRNAKRVALEQFDRDCLSERMLQVLTEVSVKA